MSLGEAGIGVPRWTGGYPLDGLEERADAIKHESAEYSEIL